MTSPKRQRHLIGVLGRRLQVEFPHLVGVSPGFENPQHFAGGLFHHRAIMTRRPQLVPLLHELQQLGQSRFAVQHAAAYALAGKMEQARTALAEALRLSPKLTIKWVARTNPVPIVLEGLRKAGLPEE